MTTEIERFDRRLGDGKMQRSPTGRWVRFTDHRAAALEAEPADFYAERADFWRNEVKTAQANLERAEDEIRRLEDYLHRIEAMETLLAREATVEPRNQPVPARRHTPRAAETTDAN